MSRVMQLGGLCALDLRDLMWDVVLGPGDRQRDHRTHGVTLRGVMDHPRLRITALPCAGVHGNLGSFQ